MSETTLPSEETLPGTVPVCEHGLDIDGNRAQESLSVQTSTQTASKACDTETFPDEGPRPIQGLTEKSSARLHSNEPAGVEDGESEEKSLFESPEVYEAPRIDSSSLSEGPSDVLSNTEHQLQPTASSTTAESPAKRDSLGPVHQGMADTPSPLVALRAHLQAMVRDERDFVHTLNSKLTRLEGVVKNVREEKNSLAAEFRDLEEHVDKLNGGVRAFDAEMRDYSLEKTARDNLTEVDLRRTDSRLSFDIPEIGDQAEVGRRLGRRFVAADWAADSSLDKT
uniref:Uncharacterized protein n=1 Tax=Branchiostoma floridae TaxID=7739 RepID=C3YTF4_BRAFL|eukprot:XP_002600509.1 hypothetical protein BRAFLDRAFT_70119 [Branchiostoma floridae]